MNYQHRWPYHGLLACRWVLALVAGTLFLGSCSETDDSDTADEYAGWQQKNDTYWNTLYASAQQRVASGDASWRIFPVWSKDESADLQPADHIVVHVLSEAHTGQSPLYTDTVRVHYTGRLIPSPSYAAGYQFDTSLSGSIDTSMPYKGAAGAFVDGFTTALLNMERGDRWEVYIPYALGYGTTERTSIPAYSTLIFDMTLAAIYPAGTVVPEWKAKPAIPGSLW